MSDAALLAVARRGDLHNGGLVNGADFVLFAACLSGPETPRPPGCALADLDVDQDVDLADLAALQAAVGAPRRG